MFQHSIPSPVGDLLITATEQGIRSLSFGTTPSQQCSELPLLAEAENQLTAYFEGRRRQFELPLDIQGTDFQRRVWQQLLTIPYGQTCSYGELAQKLGQPKATQAVGAANGRNPVAILVPCHRVIGKDGSLTGYAGGLAIKQRLLELESAIEPASG